MQLAFLIFKVSPGKNIFLSCSWSSRALQTTATIHAKMSITKHTFCYCGRRKVLCLTSHSSKCLIFNAAYKLCKNALLIECFTVLIIRPTHIKTAFRMYTYVLCVCSLHRIFLANTAISDVTCAKTTVLLLQIQSRYRIRTPSDGQYATNV